MAIRARLMLVWLILGISALTYGAEISAEKKAFSEASMAFRGEFWDRADREFGNYLAQYPNAADRAEAILLQAEARIKKPNPDYAGAIQLLESGRETAGILADEYLFWLAEAQSQSGKLTAAADSYAKFVADYPTSPRVLDAIVGGAAARFQLRQWARVVEPLADPEGLFQMLAKASPQLPASVRGRFLLAEAQLGRKLLQEAEWALSPLIGETLAPQLAWQRDYLLARIQLASGRPEKALVIATNLPTLITNLPQLSAEGSALLGGIQEQLGDADQAIKAWRQNLVATAPMDRQREALLRVGDLLISQGRLAEASQTVETFLATSPDSSAADVAWLTLGELRLRNYLQTNAPPATNAVPVTNLLPRAQLAFETVLRDFPDSPLTGKAHLGLGWCLWVNQQIDASAPEFEAAAKALPPSYEQAVAQFKLADALAQRKEFGRALSNYRAVAANTASLPGVQTNLVERALYQVVRTAHEAGDSAVANTAMAALLNQFPNGFLAERSLMTMGNQHTQLADPTAAREVFEGFARSSPDSTLLPEVRLAIARTYEQERDWTNAVSQYDGWLAAFPEHPARLRAEYYQALLEARMGNEPIALALFTNYIVRFPTNEYTPLARWWVADHFWRQEDYNNAEANYQLLYKNHPGSELRFEAQLMAGRCATARTRPEEAVSYFTNLINDVKFCPTNIQAQALFALGDTLMSLTPAETNKATENFAEAIKAFSKLAQLNPDTKIALLAQGKIGDCYLQIGAADTNSALANYNFASNAYQRILSSSTRSQSEWAQAQVGLGLVLERQSQLINGTNGAALARSALDLYLDVVFGSTRSVGEPPDMFWTKRAGLEALRLTEAMQAWPQMARLCDTLAEQLPSLQPMLEKKKARALEQSGKAAN